MIDGSDPGVRLEQVLVIEEEVRDTELLLHSLYAQGFDFSTPVIETDKATISLWKQDLLNCKKNIGYYLKSTQKRIDATNDFYQTKICTKALPEIIDDNWAPFWSIWTTESLNYQTEHEKISVICGRLVDITDKNITEPMSTLADILAHLFQRYGSPTTIYMQTLNQLETLPNPSTQTILERNLISISGAIVMASTKETGILWTCTRIGKTVNKPFDPVTQR